MRTPTQVLVGLAVAFAAQLSVASAEPYSIHDPLLATVLGTPEREQPELPARVPSQSVRLPRVGTAPVSAIFWDQREFRYSLAKQRNKAPLIFLIAGTGARYSSARMRFLKALFFGAGFHVVALSSPTHPDFILTASSHHTPGFMDKDVEDLYALMRRIRDDLTNLSVSEFNLAGYSLGATQAAFLAKHDESAREFGFAKVLLINPAVDLHSSSERLDRMFAEALPAGPTGVDRLIGDIFSRVTPYVHDRARGRLDNEFLFHVADQSALSAKELTAIIASAFRLALANMIFTVDVATGGGHVIETRRELTVGSSLTQAFKRSVRWDFDRYVNDMLLPYWRRLTPDLDRAALIGNGSLTRIGAWLAKARHVGVITNADDFILSSPDLRFLRETFGARAVIHAHGGHLGNMQHKDFAAAVLAFFSSATEDAW